MQVDARAYTIEKMHRGWVIRVYKEGKMLGTRSIANVKYDAVLAVAEALIAQTRSTDNATV